MVGVVRQRFSRLPEKVFSSAQSYLQQAIELRPASGSYVYLGLAQFKKGDLASAEQSLQRTAQMGRPQPDFYAALGVLYADQGQVFAGFAGV